MISTKGLTMVVKMDDEEKLFYLLDGSADRKVRMIRESCQFAPDHFEVRTERKEQYHDVRECNQLERSKQTWTVGVL